MSPEKIVNRYVEETLDDLDDFRQDLINQSLLATLKGDQ
jgi:hypothetical protein